MSSHKNTDRRNPKGWHTLQLLPALIALTTAMMVTLTSCRDDDKNLIKATIDPETFATMTTTQVSTLISDSGVTRYKIEAPIWLVFDEARDPRWTFPKGMHIEKYDNFFRIDATIDCDSATYFKDRQLWRLDGYVDVSNIAQEKFRTQQLFWDQRRQVLYSDSFIHIERADKVIEGYGFESDERMTKYRVLNVSGIFPAEQFQPGAEAAATDSAASATPTTVIPSKADSQRPAAQRTSQRPHVVELPAAEATKTNHPKGSAPRDRKMVELPDDRNLQPAGPKILNGSKITPKKK